MQSDFISDEEFMLQQSSTPTRRTLEERPSLSRESSFSADDFSEVDYSFHSQRESQIESTLGFQMSPRESRQSIRLDVPFERSGLPDIHPLPSPKGNFSLSLFKIICILGYKLILNLVLLQPKKKKKSASLVEEEVINIEEEEIGNLSSERLSEMILESVPQELRTKDLEVNAAIEESIKSKCIEEAAFIDVENLVDPGYGVIVRALDPTFVDTLVHKMALEPTASYTPLLLLLETRDNPEWIKDHLNEYQYQVIGRNHSREAVQRLHRKFPDHRKFKTRLCKIHLNLTKDEANYVSAFVILIFG